MCIKGFNRFVDLLQYVRVILKLLIMVALLDRN